ncbi:MAG: type II toxin-antitoxin system HicB family antitoxin [Chloroflexi bacterium]|nr:type II toxin-antitoxin system HicB family antitoxin [Chloroflexota bacterium]
MSERVKSLSGRPYRTVVRYEPAGDGSPDYIASHPEFGDACIAQGDSPEDALANLNEIREMVIAHLVEHGLAVPNPEPWPGAVVSLGDLAPSVTYTLMKVPAVRML